MRFMTVCVMLVTGAVLALAPPAHSADSDAEIEREIEQAMDQARSQLDEAARQLAELHTRKWEFENSGPRAERPMLGVLLQDEPTKQGIPLAGVTPDGGAERAGIKGGDVLVALNGVRLSDLSQDHMEVWSGALAAVSAGDPVPVTYLRDGVEHTVNVETFARSHYMTRMMAEKEHWIESLKSLEELENLEALKNLEELGAISSMEDADESAGVLRVPAGLRLEDVDGTLASYFGVERGVLVVAAGAAAAPLQAGDVVLGIGDQQATSAMEVLKTLADARGTVSAEVRRQGRSRSLELDADALNVERSLFVIRGDRHIRIHKGTGADAEVEVMIVDD